MQLYFAKSVTVMGNEQNIRQISYNYIIISKRRRRGLVSRAE